MGGAGFKCFRHFSSLVRCWLPPSPPWKRPKPLQTTLQHCPSERSLSLSFGGTRNLLELHGPPHFLPSSSFSYVSFAFKSFVSSAIINLHLPSAKITDPSTGRIGSALFSLRARSTQHLTPPADTPQREAMHFSSQRQPRHILLPRNLNFHCS